MAKHVFAGASALALLLGLQDASAQTTPSAAAMSAASPTGPAGTTTAASDSQTTVISVPAVVVTATRTPRPLNDVPESVSVITSAQIEATPATTIDGVLRRTPSVDLPLSSTNEQHPTDTIVSMRGLSGIRSLVLLDGIPINDPFFGYVQWSEVPLETVDRVEVVRGGGATLWGNYAMGGVINIVTRPITQTGLVAEAAGGSRNTDRSDGHAAYAGDGYGLGLDVGVSHSAGYLEQLQGYRGPVDANTSFTAHTLALSGDVSLAPNLTVRTRLSAYDNNQDFLTHLQTNEQHDLRGTGTMTWKPNEGGSVALTVFDTSGRFITNNTNNPAGVDPTQAEYVQNSHLTQVNELGASLVWTQVFSGPLRSLSAGADYHGIRGTDDATIYGETGGYIRTDSGAGDQRFLGGFVQADLRPVSRLQVLLSVRYQDFYNYNGLDNTPGGLGSNVPSRHDSDVDPRLSIRYQLPYGFALRGAGYRAFRAPTLDNLYRAASVPGYILYGNASLAPETLDGGEIGFDYFKGPIRFQGTAYDSYVSNLITYQNLPGDTLPAGFSQGARLINAGSARSRGFEAELTWRLARGLDTILGYTYADSVITRNPADPASVNTQQPGIPKNRVIAGIDWTAPYGIRVSPRLRYVSRTNGDPDGVFHTDSNVIVDLGVTAPVRQGVDAFVQVENIFNARYIGTNDGFTAPLYGRPLTAVFGMRLKLN